MAKSAQKAAILQVNATYTANTRSGNRQIIAKAPNPALTNW